MSDRAVLFVDGNNWYHSLTAIGLADLGRLDYSKISTKLLGPRTWVATRYYIEVTPQLRSVGISHRSHSGSTLASTAI